MIKRFLKVIYDKAQEHELSLRFLLLLKRVSLPRRVNYVLTCWEDRKLRKRPSEDMLKTQLFYLDNWPRVKELLALLADDTSKKTMGGGTTLPHISYPYPARALPGKEPVLCG